MQQQTPDPIKFGELFLDEMGLYTDPYGTVIDQETDNALQIKGKTLKFVAEDDAVYLRKNEMLFDPLHNQSLANTLFGYFINNRYSDNNYVRSYYNVANDENRQQGAVEVKIGDSIMRSGTYYMDSVKYADVMMRINNNDNVDLSDYDSKPDLRKRRNKTAR